MLNLDNSILRRVQTFVHKFHLLVYNKIHGRNLDMIYSGVRQRALSGWLEFNEPFLFSSSLRLQKFLFFYDLISLNAGEDIDTSHLRGYIQGPVYSDVYGDYTHNHEEFVESCQKSLKKCPFKVNERRAEYVSFIIKIHTETELSDMTHKLNLWKAKEPEIKSGEQQVSLDMSDYNADDIAYIDRLSRLYDDDDIKNRMIVKTGGKYFLFPIEDAKNLTEEQSDVLWNIASTTDLPNPIFAEIADSGAIIIDD